MYAVSMVYALVVQTEIIPVWQTFNANAGAGTVHFKLRPLGFNCTMNILNSFTRYSCIATNHTRQNKNKPSAVWVVREDVVQTDIIPIDYVCKKLNVNADWYISAPAKFISTVNILEPTYSAFLHRNPAIHNQYKAWA